ncbi:RebB family R body protein [Pinirhizobacter soli]|uniref:RebB family R body protein n=1 Tax=Pinirhizobacter soli TaxID=2786953 RepID=UPI00202ABEB9
MTQTNVKIPADAPAVALGNIYLDAAHALGEAVENAVNAQQQGNILGQSATTQAAIQLLSIYSMGNAASQGADGTSAPSPASAEKEAADSVARTIERAIASANKAGFDQARPWSDAVRDIMSTIAVALRELQTVSQEANMAVVKQSATATVLIAMIKAPDQLEQYQKILELIEEL